MINLKATLRYLGICPICMTAQAVKLLEHKLSHLDEDASLDMLNIFLNMLYVTAGNIALGKMN